MSLLLSLPRLLHSFPCHALTQHKIPLHKCFSATAEISPIEQHVIFGRNIFIKRDDLHCLSTCPDITGNKVRKMQSLAKMSPFPEVILSFGGTQSNAMRALAMLVHSKNLQKKTDPHPNTNPTKFLYCTKKIPEHLKTRPRGNYHAALQAGMEVSNLGLCL